MSEIGDVFCPGKLNRLDGMTVATGGAVANTGLAMNILGIKTPLMAKIGADIWGETISEILVENGGNKTWLSVSEHEKSSYSVVIALPGRDRIILHDPSVNDNFGMNDIDWDTVWRSMLFHFGYPQLMRGMYVHHGKALADIFRIAGTAGVTTSLDTAYADPMSEAGKQDWRRFYSEVLPYTDIFMPSIEELLPVLYREEYDRVHAKDRGVSADFGLGILRKIGRDLIDMGAAVVLIKCGARGIYVKTGGKARMAAMGRALPHDSAGWIDRELFSGAYDAGEVKSAIGAGDTSNAGFLASMLNGGSIEEAVSIACASGALSVTRYGAIEGLVPLDEIQKKIKDGWNRLPVDDPDGRLVEIGESGLYWFRDEYLNSGL